MVQGLFEASRVDKSWGDMCRDVSGPQSAGVPANSKGKILHNPFEDKIFVKLFGRKGIGKGL